MSDNSTVKVPSGRRRFVRRLVRVAALGGLAGLLFGHLKESGTELVPGGLKVVGASTDGTFDNVYVDGLSAGNTGTLANGLRFGTGAGNLPSNSGEGIASKCDGGDNSFGLDFYTNFTKRLSITNAGKVGIGTDNPQALLHVAGTTPNILLGDSANTITSDVVGGTISGGGADGAWNMYVNRITDDFCTIGGGDSNRAGDGDGDHTSASYATVGGGGGNFCERVC